MRVLVYEWVTAGGWRTAAPEAGGPPPPGIVAEGRAMVAALVRDAARDPEITVEVLVDAADPAEWLSGPRGSGPDLVRVPAGSEPGRLRDRAAAADWTIVVAPESDGVLAARVAAARAAGGRVAGCEPGFLAVAADKQATAVALAAAGVPVPAGRALAAGGDVPAGFHLPAVRKARGGAGGEGLVVIRAPAAVAAAPGPTRLEAFAAGTPVGVSCLCGPRGVIPLPPVVQRFSAGDRPRYLGGRAAGAAGWSSRAAALACRAVDAVARASRGAAAGWVGVDMIVGAPDDGRDDRVLEVNPRLTTSFVGLAAVHEESLLAAIVAAASGVLPRLAPVAGREVVFSASGGVEVEDGRRDS